MRLHPLRFRLRHLLVIVAAIAILLAYARWSRQQILNEHRDLHADGIAIISEPRWSDDFWNATPQAAEVYVTELSTNSYRIGSNSYTWQEIQSRLLSLKETLNGFGAKSITIQGYSDMSQASPNNKMPAGLTQHERYVWWAQRTENANQLVLFVQDHMAVRVTHDKAEFEQRWKSSRP